MNNLRTLGLLLPRVPAAAARSHVKPTAEQNSHATKLLASILNMEDSAGFLETTPHFSGQLRADLKAIRKAAKALNLRMMSEGHESITATIDTLNTRGNLLNQFALLLANAPEHIALAAMKAAADKVEEMRKPRPVRRTKQSLKQAA